MGSTWDHVTVALGIVVKILLLFRQKIVTKARPKGECPKYYLIKTLLNSPNMDCSIESPTSNPSPKRDGLVYRNKFAQNPIDDSNMGYYKTLIAT